MTTQMPPTEQISPAWESVTPRFNECVSPLTMTFGQAVVDKLGVGPGTVFLDVGAGSCARWPFPRRSEAPTCSRSIWPRP
jgi:hypothetical protein